MSTLQLNGNVGAVPLGINKLWSKAVEIMDFEGGLLDNLTPYPPPDNGKKLMETDVVIDMFIDYLSFCYMLPYDKTGNLMSETDVNKHSVYIWKPHGIYDSDTEDIFKIVRALSTVLSTQRGVSLFYSRNKNLSIIGRDTQEFRNAFYEMLQMDCFSTVTHYTKCSRVVNRQNFETALKNSFNSVYLGTN